MANTINVLSVDSIRINPNPAVIGKEVSIEATISQVHYSLSSSYGFEFPFSNESRTAKMLDVGRLSIVEMEDTPIAFVRCICKDIVSELTYSEETKSWIGTFTAPLLTSWYEEDHAYGITLWAQDIEGNRVIADRTDEKIGDKLELPVYEVATVLKVGSVEITPAPVTIGQPFSVKAKVYQEHMYVLPAAALEFPFSNTLQTRSTIQMGNYVYVSSVDIPDNEISFVRSIFNNKLIDLVYSKETDSWNGSFVAPDTTSWNEEDHSFGLMIWAEDIEGHSVIVDRNDGDVGNQLLIPVYDTVTVLKIDSVLIAPNPVKVEEEYSVEVAISQEHNYVLYAGSFEFPFSNESFTKDLLETGSFMFGPDAHVPDNEMSFVKYKIGDSSFDLSYSAEKGMWVGVFKAPSTTSWNEEDHAYGASLWAEDIKGNVVSVDRTDLNFGEDLKLRVLDRTPPEIILISPTALSYLTASKPRFTFKIEDLSPGINLESLKIFVDGKSIPYTMELITDEDGNEFFSCVSKQSVKNGIHSYQISISDYDLNETFSEIVNFTVDTTAGHGETFVMGNAMFEWFRKQVLVASGVMEFSQFDMNLVFDWMRSRPETGDHLFQIATHHDDDRILYKLEVEVKR